MRRARIIYILFIVAALLVAVMAGCDRLTGEFESNIPPEVSFINVPLDSTEFNFAPEVHWTGYDPDGLIDAFQYYDDASQAAVEAYRAGDEALVAYINTIPAESWVTTLRTSETIYLLTTQGDTTEHVFMLRAVDNNNAVSPVKVRTFFRTNQPPDAPKLRWTLGSTEYNHELVITDTLFWGDTLTVAYNGVQFLWQGSDPDSRALNIIPLEFSYLLVNGTTGDTAEVPIYDDSLNIIGYQADWSTWSESAQATFFGYDTGDFTFYLRVRDDGLTLSDTIATATFTAINPLFDDPDLGKQLLIVDENKPLAGADAILGGYHPDSIMAFYQESLPRAYELADVIRLLIPVPPIPAPGYEPIPPFVDYPNQVVWYNNRSAAPLPYGEIHKYKWVWIISDDNSTQPNLIDEREQVLADYMSVGGRVMISGRSLFNGTFTIPNAGAARPFLQRYFGLFSVRSKPYQWRSSHEAQYGSYPDFGGATTADPLYADVEVDSALVQTLQFGADHVSCLPNVDYFGRSTSQQSFDYSVTLFNYSSCTANRPDTVDNEDFDVVENLTSASRAVIRPILTQTRLTTVTRVYNRTKNVYGDFQYTDNLNQVVVSTPISAGMWTDADTLEVDYIFIPVSLDHDQPVGIEFSKYEGLIDFNQVTGEVNISGVSRYRTSLFTFPLCMLKNEDVQHPFLGMVKPVDLLIANQFIWFNSFIGFQFIQN